MSENNNPMETVARIQDVIHELLSHDWKDQIKAERLLKILHDSNKLKERIERQRIAAEPTQKWLLEATIKQAQKQKKYFQQLDKVSTQNEQAEQSYIKKLLEALEAFFCSLYQIKQLQYLININSRSEEVIGLLLKIRNELKSQFYQEQTKIEEEQQSQKQQQKILKTIEGQITEKVESLEEKRKALKVEVEKSLVLEMEQRRQYKESLKAENEKKLQLALSSQEQPDVQVLRRSSDSSQAGRQQVNNANKTATELKLETIKIPPSYKIEITIATVLSFVSLFLIIYHLAKS